MLPASTAVNRVINRTLLSACIDFFGEWQILLPCIYFQTHIPGENREELEFTAQRTGRKMCI